MHTHISLLRGINVGGQKPIRMAGLKAMYEALGFTEVTTYIQSGNVICRSSEADPEKIAGLIRETIEQTFGYQIGVVMRTPLELQQVFSNNPFLPDITSDIKTLHCAFLSDAPDNQESDPLAGYDYGADKYRLSGKEVYLHYPQGAGNTRLTNTHLEKRLGVTATTRNWRTVAKLLEMCP